MGTQAEMQLAELIERHRRRFQPLFDPPLSSDNTIYMELSNGGPPQTYTKIMDGVRDMNWAWGY